MFFFKSGLRILLFFEFGMIIFVFASFFGILSVDLALSVNKSPHNTVVMLAGNLEFWGITFKNKKQILSKPIK